MAITAFETYFLPPGFSVGLGEHFLDTYPEEQRANDPFMALTENDGNCASLSLTGGDYTMILANLETSGIYRVGITVRNLVRGVQSTHLVNYATFFYIVTDLDGNVPNDSRYPNKFPTKLDANGRPFETASLTDNDEDEFSDRAQPIVVTADSAFTGTLPDRTETTKWDFILGQVRISGTTVTLDLEHPLKIRETKTEKKEGFFYDFSNRVPKDWKLPLGERVV